MRRMTQTLFIGLAILATWPATAGAALPSWAQEHKDGDRVIAWSIRPDAVANYKNWGKAYPQNMEIARFIAGKRSQGSANFTEYIANSLTAALSHHLDSGPEVPTQLVVPAAGNYNVPLVIHRTFRDDGTVYEQAAILDTLMGGGSIDTGNGESSLMGISIYTRDLKSREDTEPAYHRYYQQYVHNWGVEEMVNKPKTNINIITGISSVVEVKVRRCYFNGDHLGFKNCDQNKTMQTIVAYSASGLLGGFVDLMQKIPMFLNPVTAPIAAYCLIKSVTKGGALPRPPLESLPAE